MDETEATLPIPFDSMLRGDDVPAGACRPVRAAHRRDRRAVLTGLGLIVAGSARRAMLPACSFGLMGTVSVSVRLATLQRKMVPPEKKG